MNHLAKISTQTNVQSINFSDCLKKPKVQARNDLPPLIYGSELHHDLVAAMLHGMNSHLSKYYIGSGFYAPDLVLDQENPEKQHFKLFCDDTFLDAFLADTIIVDYSAVS